ncbi:MAG: hypothetical protein HYU66_15105 [Armatimonadetes bacterium]|nr:hypothetical protein [Armatimonadota bacterium]
MAAAEQPGTPQRGFTLRAIVVAIAFAWFSAWWMKHDEMMSHTVQLGESVPAIPSVFTLFVFLLVNPLLARLSPRLALTRQEAVVVFVVLTITPIMNTVGMMRMLLPATTVASYFATPENHLDRIWPLIPSWYGPHDPEVIRQMFEGSDSGAVPWSIWWGPIFRWSLFALAFYVCMMSLNVLLRKQWSERERLSFPLVQFVTPLTPDASSRFAGIVRDPLLWTGLGISFIYNGLNMAHAINPAVMAPDKQFALGTLFTERPWSALSGLSMAYRPEIVGLGYLMATDVTLSCWVSFLGLQLIKVGATAAGTIDQMPGFPFDQELSMGGFLAIFVFIFWVGRRHLATALRAAFGRDRDVDAEEPARYRTAFAGLVLSFAFMLGFGIHAGMTPWLALLYFGLVVGVALAYARIRAETGHPMIFGFPFWQQQKAITNLFGSARLAPDVAGDTPYAGFRSLTILHSFAWLARGFYTTTAASQIEGFKLADETATRRRDMLLALLFAGVIGLAFAWHTHLTAYYEFGGNVLERGTTEGGYRISLMRTAYEEVAKWTQTPQPPDVRRNWALLVGFLFTVTLFVLRAAFLRFPLHPLGFAMITAYSGPVWGPLMIVWGIKVAVLRVGGVRLYKRLIPLFIGLSLGHFFANGVIWGFVAIFYEELAEKYPVWFG